MYQAGLRKLTLYENTGIVLIKDIDGSILSISTAGHQVDITADQRPTLKINAVTGKNREILYEYFYEFYLFGLIDDTLDLFEILKKSLNGFVAVAYFNDSTNIFYYNIPVYCVEDSEMDTNQSMTFHVKLQTRVATRVKKISFLPTITTGYRADTTVLTADNAILTADYRL